jgi:hypothetical protein
MPSLNIRTRRALKAHQNWTKIIFVKPRLTLKQNH